MFNFGIINFWRQNKYKIMIFGSIIILIILFILRHLSEENKKKLIKETSRKIKKANIYMKKIRNEKKNFDKIFSDIYSDDDEDDIIIKKKRWMPQMSKGEERCKIYLENYLNKPFNKIRPDLLKNSVTGHNLEIDLYNDELKLGVEYNGLQHYKFCPGIHKNYEHFQTQRYRDEMKKMMCKDAGITLIEVPYTEKDIEDFLFKELSIRGFNKLG